MDSRLTCLCACVSQDGAVSEPVKLDTTQRYISKIFSSFSPGMDVQVMLNVALCTGSCCYDSEDELDVYQWKLSVEALNPDVQFFIRTPELRQNGVKESSGLLDTAGIACTCAQYCRTSLCDGYMVSQQRGTQHSPASTKTCGNSGIYSLYSGQTTHKRILGFRKSGTV